MGWGGGSGVALVWGLGESGGGLKIQWRCRFLAFNRPPMNPSKTLPPSPPPKKPKLQRAAKHTLEEVLSIMKAARVPAGPILSTFDLLTEPQFVQRGMFETAAPPAASRAAKVRVSATGGSSGAASGGGSKGARGGAVVMPAIVPVMHGTPGSTRWAGAALGHHTDEVLRGELGLGADEIERLRGLGAIA